MIIEEEETKTSEVNPDIIDEALFVVGEDVDEVEVLMFGGEDEQADALDLAFTEDEGHW